MNKNNKTLCIFYGAYGYKTRWYLAKTILGHRYKHAQQYIVCLASSGLGWTLRGFWSRSSFLERVETFNNTCVESILVPFHKQFFNQNSNMMEIPFCFIRFWWTDHYKVYVFCVYIFIFWNTFVFDWLLTSLLVYHKFPTENIFHFPFTTLLKLWFWNLCKYTGHIVTCCMLRLFKT